MAFSSGYSSTAPDLSGCAAVLFACCRPAVDEVDNFIFLTWRELGAAVANETFSGGARPPFPCYIDSYASRHF